MDLQMLICFVWIGLCIITSLTIISGIKSILIEK